MSKSGDTLHALPDGITSLITVCATSSALSIHVVLFFFFPSQDIIFHGSNCELTRLCGEKTLKHIWIIQLFSFNI